MIALTARLDGQKLPDSSVIWSAQPADAIAFESGGRARIRSTDPVIVTARTEVGSASVKLEPNAPPTIVFDMAVSGNRDIYLVALDGQDLVRLTNHPGEDLKPTAAKGRVVFVSYRDGNGELYSVSLDGRTEVRITDTRANEGDPALSPDGMRLAYTRTDGGVPKLYTAGPNGENARRLSIGFGYPGSVEASPTWAPGSMQLAFVSTSLGSADLFTLDVAELQFSLLLPDSGSSAEVEPAWSRDGNRVAFASNRTPGGDTEIYVIELPRKRLLRLTMRPGIDAQPAWLSDGRLVYTAWIGGQPQLRWLDPARPDEVHTIHTLPGRPQHPSGIWN
ncbi:Dipeptidyl-peptidase 5 [bacterium HR33]|nr:Dipeptidyl-peptidase 5 [bacterium HR33]